MGMVFSIDPKMYMNRTSLYINSLLFIKLFREHFIARKPSEKCFLILEGHAFHCNVFRLLEVANSHVTILCFSSLTCTGSAFLFQASYGLLQSRSNGLDKNPQRKESNTVTTGGAHW